MGASRFTDSRDLNSISQQAGATADLLAADADLIGGWASQIVRGMTERADRNVPPDEVEQAAQAMRRAFHEAAEALRAAAHAVQGMGVDASEVVDTFGRFTYGPRLVRTGLPR